MKYQKAHKQVDEREKLRKFRELDDAFAEALRQLDSPGNRFDIPTGPPVRSLKELEEQDNQARANERATLFAERLKALGTESGFSKKATVALVKALIDNDVWRERETPAITEASVACLRGSDKSAG